MNPQQSKEYLEEQKTEIERATLQELNERLDVHMERHAGAKGKFEEIVRSDGPLHKDWFYAIPQMIYRRIQEINDTARADSGVADTLDNVDCAMVHM